MARLLHGPSIILPLLVIALSLMSGKEVAASRHLLEEPTLPKVPELPKPAVPTLPKVELPPLPHIPEPTLPTLPKPELPTVPALEKPELPPLPKLEIQNSQNCLSPRCPHSQPFQRTFPSLPSPHPTQPLPLKLSYRSRY